MTTDTTLREVMISRAWAFAVAFGVFAYLFHRIGAILGYYPRFFWFQMVAHFLSATAMALLLVRFGLASGLSGRRLLAFVVVFSIVGAVGWELTEYLKLWPDLNWWGIEDSLLDLSMDAAGVVVVLLSLRTRLRRLVHPELTTPPARDLLLGEE